MDCERATTTATYLPLRVGRFFSRSSSSAPEAIIKKALSSGKYPPIESILLTPMKNIGEKQSQAKKKEEESRIHRSIDSTFLFSVCIYSYSLAERLNPLANSSSALRSSMSPPTGEPDVE